MSQSKRAIYAGSFDPITNGHIDIINRACVVFDEVVLLLALSPSKNALFSFDERRDQLKKIFLDNRKIKVDYWDGLTVDYADLKKINHLIRGLRPTGDFDSEFQMAAMNRSLNKELDIVFFMTSDETYFLSSSLVKEVFFRGGDVSKFVPKLINDSLLSKKK